jgi:hypothetical protein
VSYLFAKAVWIWQIGWCLAFSVLAAHAEFASTWGVFADPPRQVNWGGLAASACYALLAIAWRPSAFRVTESPCAETPVQRKTETEV